MLSGLHKRALELVQTVADFNPPCLFGLERRFELTFARTEPLLACACLGDLSAHHGHLLFELLLLRRIGQVRQRRLHPFQLFRRLALLAVATRELFANIVQITREPRDPCLLNSQPIGQQLDARSVRRLALQDDSQRVDLCQELSQNVRTGARSLRHDPNREQSHQPIAVTTWRIFPFMESLPRLG